VKIVAPVARSDARLLDSIASRSSRMMQIGIHTQGSEEPMTSPAARLELSGLDNLDLAELQQELQKAGISLETSRQAGAQTAEQPHRHGELGTALIILAVTPAVLGVVSLWLARKHDGEEFEETVTTVAPDGTRSERMVKYKRSASEAPEAAILSELRRVTGLDHAVLGIRNTPNDDDGR
jgi:hypothetical protein